MSAREVKPPVTSVLRDARVAAYQTAILDAAERVFVEAGFESAKMEDIARAAGVAKGTVYNYFANKEAVFSALADRGRSQLLELVDQAVAAATPEDRPRAFVHTVLSCLEEGARMALVYMHATGLALLPALDPRAPQGRVMLTERMRESLRPLYEAGQLRQDIELERLVVMLGGLLMATIQDFLERGHERGLVDATDSIMSLFMQGAQSR